MSLGSSTASPNKSDMRILFHHRTQGQGVEGIHIQGLVRALRAAGHEVDLVSPPGVVVADRLSTTTGTSWLRRAWRFSSRVSPEVFFELMELAYNLAAIHRLNGRMSLHAYDAIYERYALFNMAGLYAARRANVPLVLEVNYTAQTPLYRKRSRLLQPFARAIERFLFRRADAIIVVSTVLQDELLRSGVEAERIGVVPNAADPNVFRPEIRGDRIRRLFGLEGKRVIGFVGGFYPWHGLEMILEAFPEITRKVENVAVLLVGEGPLKRVLEERTRLEGMAEQIHFAGRVAHADLPEYIAAFDVAVMPDSNEYGSPMKIYEYMAMGRPVVAPRLGPLKDGIVHGEVGLLFPRRDARALATSIAALLENSQLCLEMGRRARQHVLEKHTWKRNAERVLGLLQQVQGRHNSSKELRGWRMELPVRAIEWIAEQSHLLVSGAITFSFPRTFLRGVYRHNIKSGVLPGKVSFTLSFDCDYPRDVETIPAVLAMLAPYRFKASFACVGYWIEQYPREHAMILENGHEIVNHTYSHPDNEILNPGRKFREISRAEKKEEVELCHEASRKVLGYEPIGCRIPHFKHLFTPDIYGILQELGYKYSSSTWLTNTKSFGMPFVAEGGIVEFPLSVCPAHPFTVFDTWHSLNTSRWSHRIVHRGPEQYCELFETLLDIGEETGSYLNVYLDPWDVTRIPDFPKILDRLSDQERFRVATYQELISEVVSPLEVRSRE